MIIGGATLKKEAGGGHPSTWRRGAQGAFQSSSSQGSKSSGCSRCSFSAGGPAWIWRLWASAEGSRPPGSRAHWLAPSPHPPQPRQSTHGTQAARASGTWWQPSSPRPEGNGVSTLFLCFVSCAGVAVTCDVVECLLLGSRRATACSRGAVRMCCSGFSSHTVCHAGLSAGAVQQCGLVGYFVESCVCSSPPSHFLCPPPASLGNQKALCYVVRLFTFSKEVHLYPLLESASQRCHILVFLSHLYDRIYFPPCCWRRPDSPSFWPSDTALWACPACSPFHWSFPLGSFHVLLLCVVLP